MRSSSLPLRSHPRLAVQSFVQGHIRRRVDCRQRHMGVTVPSFEEPSNSHSPQGPHPRGRNMASDHRARRLQPSGESWKMWPDSDEKHAIEARPRPHSLFTLFLFGTISFPRHRHRCSRQRRAAGRSTRGGPLEVRPQPTTVDKRIERRPGFGLATSRHDTPHYTHYNTHNRLEPTPLFPPFQTSAGTDREQEQELSHVRFAVFRLLRCFPGTRHSISHPFQVHRGHTP